VVSASANKNDMANSLKEEVKKMDLETLKKDHPELVAQLTESVSAPVREELDKEKTRADETAAELLAAQEQVKTLQEQIDAHTAKEEAAAFAEKVKSHLAEKLHKDLITEAFTQEMIKLGPGQWEKVEALTEERASLVVTAGPKGMGVKASAEGKPNPVDAGNSDERLGKFRTGLEARSRGF